MTDPATADIAPARPAAAPPFRNGGVRREEGVGGHLERLLRAAEQEAAEIRETAELRAAALLTQAHVEIDRHERDQRQDWQDREQAVAAAEQRAAAALTAAHDHAVELLADATTQADADAQRIRGHAYLRAKQITAAAEQTATTTLHTATAEVERLHQIGTAARAEIGRLLRTLDGIRDALAYELHAAHIHDSAQAHDPSPTDDPAQAHGGGHGIDHGSAQLTGPDHSHNHDDGDLGLEPVSKRAAAAPIAIGSHSVALGQRRGDLRRARLTDLIKPREPTE